MKDKTVHKKRSHFITKDDIAGYLFVLPFLIGFVFLLAKPMLESIVYSFSEVLFGEGGMTVNPVGLENYSYALFSDADFFKKLISSVIEILWNIPVIMFFSMFMAILLTGEFVGRLFFRMLLFLPVIFAVPAFLENIEAAGMGGRMAEGRDSVAATSDTLQLLLTDLVNNFGLPSELVSKLQEYVSNIFDICWKSGIQIILFIIGLQAIPSYLYEVCELEGATKWETFWKITFPLLSPTILLCLIYTIIDLFNSPSNQVITIITANMGQRIHYACAQTWLYSLAVFAFVLIVYRLVAKRAIYLD